MDWQSSEYKSLKQTAEIISNSLVIKPNLQAFSKSGVISPLEILSEGSNSLSPESVIKFLNSLWNVERCETAANGPLSNFDLSSAIKNVLSVDENRSVHIECVSLYAKRVLKRVINKHTHTANHHSPGDIKPHHLVARDRRPDRTHKVYHQAVHAIRRRFGPQIGTNFASLWINPICYQREKPYLLPRVTLAWFTLDASTGPTGSPSTSLHSLLFHPGIRRPAGVVAMRSGKKGSTVQLETRLHLAPFRPDGQWLHDLLADMSRAIATAEYATLPDSVTSCIPLPSCKSGKYYKPGHQLPGCSLTGRPVHNLPPPVTQNTPSPQRVSSAQTGECTYADCTAPPAHSRLTDDEWPPVSASSQTSRQSNSPKSLSVGTGQNTSPCVQARQHSSPSQKLTLVAALPNTQPSSPVTSTYTSSPPPLTLQDFVMPGNDRVLRRRDSTCSPIKPTNPKRGPTKRRYVRDRSTTLTSSRNIKEFFKPAGKNKTVENSLESKTADTHS